MTRALLILLLLSGVAYAEKLRFYGAGGAGPAPPPTCTADGGTDWSNACDLGLLAAIGF